MLPLLQLAEPDTAGLNKTTQYMLAALLILLMTGLGSTLTMGQVSDARSDVPFTYLYRSLARFNHLLVSFTGLPCRKAPEVNPHRMGVTVWLDAYNCSDAMLCVRLEC